MRARRATGALVRACHPLPTAAVTVFASAFALVTVEQPPATVLGVASAVLVGQLSIGWSNDARDAPLDRAAGRADKPAVDGAVSARTLWVAAALAAAACVPLSLALGLVAGLVHVVAVVGSGWAYNLRLKRTVASPVPYLVAFGMLPAVAGLAGPVATWPSVAVLTASALLGAGAHFANVVADIPGDLAADVRGLPQRLGPRRSLAATAGLVLLAAVVVVASARPGPAGLVLATGGCLTAAAALRVPPARAFPVTLAAVALVVAAVLVA